MMATRYYQVVNTLIDPPEELEYDPVVVSAPSRRGSTPHAAWASATVVPTQVV
jgi:hypothetical protein